MPKREREAGKIISIVATRIYIKSAELPEEVIKSTEPFIHVQGEVVGWDIAGRDHPSSDKKLDGREFLVHSTVNPAGLG